MGVCVMQGLNRGKRIVQVWDPVLFQSTVFLMNTCSVYKIFPFFECLTIPEVLVFSTHGIEGKQTLLENFPSGFSGSFLFDSDNDLCLIRVSCTSCRKIQGLSHMAT